MEENGSRTATCVVGLIGAGIGTSFSPPLHEAEASALGIRYAYQLIDIDELGVDPADAGRLLAEARDMGFSGLNITHPCKQTVLDHLDGLSDEAAAVGAVNTVVFRDGKAIGYNTDEIAFRASFINGLGNVALDAVVLLGAGGAGAAVARAILTLGARRLSVVDLEQRRAAGLALSLREQFAGVTVDAVSVEGLSGALARADGLIHATPSGMAGQPDMPLLPELIRADLWIADIVYRPLNTRLLQHARRMGCRTLDGGGMVVIQAAESFALFTGIEPDQRRMFRRFDELVAEEAAVDQEIGRAR